LVLDLEQTDELLALAGHLPLQAGSTPKQTAPTHSAGVGVWINYPDQAACARWWA